MAQQRVTITDVARAAGVSAATASVVINNKEKYVAPQLRQQVLEAVERLNYQPNLVARSLKVQETRTIGLILTNITSPVTPASVRLVQRHARYPREQQTQREDGQRVSAEDAHAAPQ